MTVSIRIGDTYRIPKNADGTYKEGLLQTIDSSSLTKEILIDRPFEFYSKKTKLFFDYDENSDDIGYVREKRNMIRDKLIEHRRHYTEGFVFTESVSDNKISFHIIFKKINIIRADFIKEDEKELFCKLVGEENFQHIDPNVYGKKTCFRLPYGTRGMYGKSDKEHAHIPFVGNGERENLSDYVLSLPDDAECKTYTTQLGRAMKKQLEEDAKAYQDYDEEPDERQDKISRMLAMVKLERFTQYNNWLALMVLMKTHKLPLDLFLKMSEESGYAYFDEIKCRQAWRSCKESESFGIPLVVGWLKQDGVDIKKHFPTQSPLLKELLNGWYRQGTFTDQNVATALFNHYKESLIYTSQGWFHYKNKWVLGKKESIFHPVMVLLSTELLNYIDSGLDKSLKKMLQGKSDDESDKLLAKMRMKLRNDVNNLQSSSTIKHVLETAEGLFLDNNALDTFDKKPNWFCFADQKAIDLRTKETITIQAKDRILTTCGYNLPEDSKDDIEKVMKIIDTVIPKENKESFLSSLSIFLYGENINEKFIVYKGEGRNGKGLLISLLEKALGNYFYALPTEVLTEHSKGAGRPNPELAQTRWSRCVMASEPDAKRQIVKTTMNLLTGRDTITVRQLRCEPFSFLPPFTLGMMCNDVPNVSGGINDALAQRIEFQIFPYTFVENPEPDTNQRKIDTSLKNLLRDDISYRNGLLHILIDTWHKNNGKYISCNDSKEEQDHYAKENNPIMVWLEKYEPSTEFIRIKVLHNKYKDLYGDGISPAKFKEYLKQANVKIQDDTKNGHKIYIKEKPILGF